MSVEASRAAVLDELPVAEANASRTKARRLQTIRVASIVVSLGLWEALGRQVNPLFMSYPSAIVIAGWNLAVTGVLGAAVWESVRTLVTGFASGAVVGVGLGLLIGRYAEVDAALDWLINALYATPLVALIPLLILWLGLGFPAKLAVVFLFTLFPVLINTAIGVKNVNRALIDVAQAFVANERQIFTKIILPASLPYTMAGLRLGIGRAIIGMVTAEFFTAISGLGGLVVKYGNEFKTAEMLVPVLLLMALGVALTALLQRAELAIAPWKAQDESE